MTAAREESAMAETSLENESAREGVARAPRNACGPSKQARRRLARELARQCRGRTGVSTPVDPDLARAMARRNVVPVRYDPAGAPFDTVLLLGVVEHESPEGTKARLREARRRLADDGRLVVCVPNGDADRAGAGSAEGLTRRRLHRLLRPLGRPRLVTGQPFRWLVMRVELRARPSAGVEERYRVIARLCRGHVLELGCGTGELTRTVADRGLRCTGVEINAAKVREATRWHPHVEFVQSDILALRDEGKRWDTVVLSEVLEHVDEETGDAMLERAWSLLAPGGRLVVSVPNEDCVPHPNHVREFTRRNLARLLRRFGRTRVVDEQPYRYLLMTVAKRKQPQG